MRERARPANDLRNSLASVRTKQIIGILTLREACESQALSRLE